MRLGSTRQFMAAAVVCLLTAGGCNCGRIRLRQVSKPAIVEGVGGVSCNGEAVRLTTLIKGGTAPFTYQWSPTDGLSDPTSASPMATVSETRTYTLTVTDAKGQESTSVAQVQRRQPPTINLSFTQGGTEICDGTQVALDATGTHDSTGKPVQGYFWDLGSVAPTPGPSSAVTGAFTPHQSQVVRLRVMDDLGCEASVEKSIDVRALPQVAVSFAQGASEMCAGDQIQLQGSATDADGNAVQKLSWDLDGNPMTIEATGALTQAYRPTFSRARLIATDAKGCRAAVTQPLILNPLPMPVVRFISGASNVCAGTNVTLDASASTNGSGGPVSLYAWDIDGDPSTVESADAISPTISAAGITPVRLTVFSDKGCAATVGETITGRALPRAAITFDEGRANVCLGGSVKLSGATSVDADGRPVASYGWDLDGNGTVDQTSAVTSAITPATDQTAKLVVTDAMGCRSELTQTITPRALPTPVVSFASGAATICSGDQVALDGSQSFDADGKAVRNLAWDLDGNSTTTEATGTNTGLFQPTSAPVRLLVTDALGCQSATTQAITTHLRPTARIAYTTGSNNICAGFTVALDASGSTDASGNQVSNVAWDLDGDPATIESNQAQPPAITASTSRPIHLTVTDTNGCTSDAFDLLTVRAKPIPRVTFDQGRQNACIGDTVALSGATSDDGTGNPVARYEWDLDGNATTVESTSPTLPTMSLTTPRQVQLKVVGTNGCESAVTQSLAPRALPTARITFASGRSNVCLGNAVSLTGETSTDADGNPLQSFFWQSTDLNTAMDPSDPVTPSFTPTQNQTVQLVVADALGCRSTATQALSPRGLPTPVLKFAQGSAAVCSGAQVALDGGDSHDIDGNPVTTYAWDLDSNGRTDATGLNSGLFQPTSAPATLVVTDALGCTGRLSQSITSNQQPTARISYLTGSNDVCLGGSIRLDASGSTDTLGAPVVSYAWDLDGNPATIESTVAKPAALSPTGSHDIHLTVTDANGCTSSAYDFLTVLALPTPAIRFTQGGAAVCNGTTVGVDASTSHDGFGQPVARYEWDLDGNASTVESTAAAPASFVASSGRTMGLRVYDSNGCTAATSQTVTTRALPTPRIAFASGRSNVCVGGAVSLTGASSTDADGQPISTFRWDLDSNGTVDQSTQITSSFTPTGAQTAKLTVIDGMGCSSSTTQPIAPRALPTASIAFAQGRSNVCLGGVVSLTAAASRDADGNAVSSYAWDLDSNGSVDQTTPVTSAFTPGSNRTAKLTVTDGLGCVGSATQAIAPRALPTATITFAEGSSLMCNGQGVRFDGTSSRDADGNPVASYAWDLDANGSVDETGNTTSRLTPSSSRTVSLAVTDTLGCTSSSTKPVTVRALPTPRITVTSGSATMCSGSSVRLSGSTTTDADGNPVSSYSWDLDSDGTVDATTAITSTFTPSGTATANLNVTDSFGCTASTTQPLTVNPRPTAVAGAGGAVCPGGSVSLGSAPVAGYTYQWMPATGLSSATSASPLATPASTTNYSLTVTNQFGCQATDTSTVTIFPQPVANAGPDRQLTPGGNVQLLGGASGGTGGYSYAWTPAATLDNAALAQPRAMPPINTTYGLTVTDANGCQSTDSTRVDVVAPMTLTAGPDQLFCINGGSGVTLAATTTGGVGTLSYQWTASPSCAGCIANPTSPTTTVSPTVPTTFTVTVTDANGSQISDSTVVNTSPGFTVDAGSNRNISTGQVTQIGAAPVPGLTYSWTCDKSSCGLSNATVSNPWAAPLGTTVYTVTATDGNTCTGTATVTVLTEVRVVSTLPYDGHALWPRQSPFYITFDADMDPSTMPGKFHLYDPGDTKELYISWTYDAPTRTVIINPETGGCSGVQNCTGQKGYQNNVTYQLRVEGGPSGIATVGPNRRTLKNDYVITFDFQSSSDNSSPAITFRSPISGATNVVRNPLIAVRFDEGLDPRTANGTNFSINGVTSTFRYDPKTFTVYLRPTSPLAANQTYTVKISSAKDAKGNPTNATWSFTTGTALDTTAPTVTSSYPANGATGVDVAVTASATFSELIDFTTLGAFSIMNQATGMPIPAEVVYDVVTQTATLEPWGFLDGNVGYQLMLAGVKDEAGLLIPSSSWTFTAQPTIMQERFEGGLAGWSLQAPWNADFQAAYTGSFGLSDSPGGDYGDNVNASATTPSINVAGRSSVSVTYWARFSIATDGDKGYLEYSTNNGSTWSTAATVGGITGFRVWSYTVPTNGASSLKLRMRMVTNSSLHMGGWFMDELVVR